MALERLMTRHLLLIHMMLLSLLLGSDIVQIQLYNGQEVQGEFIGTYMNHVHILIEEETYYYACDDILSVLSPRKGFDYDCSENTVTADILFPPELDPMTGEWVQRLPDVFNPDIVKPIVKKVADAVDTNPPTVDLSVVETQFEEEVSTFEEPDVAEEDFIMIDGVKYVRASLDGEIDQDNLPRTTKKKWDLYEEDRDRRVTKKKTNKKSKIQLVGQWHQENYQRIQKSIVKGCMYGCLFNVIWIFFINLTESGP